ncbi:MAG: hypothetical protein JNM93_04090 [Bacteriovoracaceae bacterium]|nr:hypothetical protein [Bacteriovoracaceae bacterium]
MINLNLKTDVSYIVGSAVWSLALLLQMMDITTATILAYSVLAAGGVVRMARFNLIENTHPVAKKINSVINNCKRFFIKNNSGKLSFNSSKLQELKKSIIAGIYLNNLNQVNFSRPEKTYTENYLVNIDSLHTNLTNLGRRLA